MIYIVSYVYFINISGSLIVGDNNWYEHYLNIDQINRETVNS